MRERETIREGLAARSGPCSLRAMAPRNLEPPRDSGTPKLGGFWGNFLGGGLGFGGGRFLDILGPHCIAVRRRDQI